MRTLLPSASYSLPLQQSEVLSRQGHTVISLNNDEIIQSSMLLKSAVDRFALSDIIARDDIYQAIFVRCSHLLYPSRYSLELTD